MEHLGGVYSSQVCFFRGTEQDGYPFLEQPFLLDCIAVAAYRKPRIVGGRLEDKVARSTKQKIRRIFLIALEKGHDSLVLGALGCGAFQNPPKHIAELFEEVIHEFAGRFKMIIFAVIDDHNSSSNYKIFQRHFERNQGIFQAPTTLSPHLISNGVGTECSGSTCAVFSNRFTQYEEEYADDGQRRRGGTPKPAGQSRRQLPECRYGGLCRDLGNLQHRKQYAHPPVCRGGGLCDQRHKESHLKEFIHPPPCRYRGLCTEPGSEHIKNYLHPVECRYGVECMNDEFEHLLQYHHGPKMRCRDEWSCGQMKNVQHLKQFSHQILPPCKHYEACNQTDDANHMDLYSHRCQWGPDCHKLKAKDAQHNRKYYHVYHKETNQSWCKI
jgi:hypothetical protein